MSIFNEWEHHLINITRQQNLTLAEANNLDMTKSIKASTKEKWFLLLICLIINALLVHHMTSGEANLLFSKRDNDSVFLYSALFSIVILTTAIHLSYKDFMNSLKINFGILMMILINLFFTGLHIFLIIVTHTVSVHNGF